MNRTLLYTVFLSLLIGACSDAAPEKPKEKKGHVWQGQVDTLQKARDVQGVLDEHARQQEERLNAIEGQ